MTLKALAFIWITHACILPLSAQISITETFADMTIDINPATIPLIGDVDKDNETEIVVLSNEKDSVYIYDGATHIVERRFGIAHNEAYCCSQPGGNMAIGDANGDGNVDLLITGTNLKINCYEIPTGLGVQSATLLWTSNVTAGSREDGPFLADFNQDGTPEVYAANKIFSGTNGSLLVQPNGGTNNPVGQVACGPCLVAGVWSPALPVAVDVLPDTTCLNCSGLELVAGNTVYAIASNFSSMTPEVSIAGQGFSDGPVSVGDIDGDGDLDAALVVMQSPGIWGIVGWDLQTTGVLGFYPFPSSTWAGRVNLADLDCDPELEMTVVSEDVIYFVDSDFQLLSTFPVDDNSRSTSVTAFDFDGDGTEEIVYRGESTLHILDGGTGVSLADTNCGSPTAVEFPVIADVDNNGDAEIITICGSSYRNGKLRIYDSGGAPWANARPVLNQHAYYNVNINDDLSVPMIQLDHHNVPGLNGFLNQAASLSPVVPSYPSTDASISITNASYDGTDYTVEVEVCNTALAGQDLPPGAPIQFFDGDPQSPFPLLLFSSSTTQLLSSGNCETLTFTFPGNCDTVFAYVPDSLECDARNNIDSISLDCTPISDCDSLQLNPEFTYTLSGPVITVTDISAGSSSYIEWVWGDGNSQLGLPGETTTYTYGVQGTYQICLLVHTFLPENICCTDSICEMVEVSIDTCYGYEANFIVQQDPIDVFSFTFTDQSSNFNQQLLGVHSLWDLGDGNVAVGNGYGSSTTHTFGQTGSFDVQLTSVVHLNDTLCCVDSTTISIDAGRKYNLNLRLSPNPASDLLVIEYDNPNSLETELTLLTNTGVVIDKWKVGAKGKETIEVSDLSPGIYLVGARGEEEVSFAKFMKL